MTSLSPAEVRPYDEAAIRAINRPDRSLLTYYFLASLPALPLFPLFMFLRWVRYSTLQYTFTDEGISMRWGRLFRGEIILNYARIQDIHLRSNIVERWFGLARILVQTASGSSGAEMTIEGLKEYEAVRDFLYSKMRGVTDSPAATPERMTSSPGEMELVETLREVARELRAAREGIEAWRRAEEGASQVAAKTSPIGTAEGPLARALTKDQGGV